MSIAAQLHLSGTLVETNMNRRMQTVVESGLQSLCSVIIRMPAEL
jgi:hypothetical protein